LKEVRTRIEQKTSPQKEECLSGTISLQSSTGYSLQSQSGKDQYL
jgi:hypothetical protein